MENDEQLKHDVESELHWCPEIDATDIAVSACENVVTLSGFSPTFQQKIAAEAAVKRLRGVKGVVNEISVRGSGTDQPTDAEIARAAVNALSHQVPAIAEGLKVLVHDARVTLEGSTQWHFLRQRAEEAVRWLPGVLDVNNAILVQPKAAAKDIKAKIEEAFHRNAEVDGQGISVETTGGVVTLLGKVRSWSEREEAQRTAYSAPGVTEVKNKIVVR